MSSSSQFLANDVNLNTVAVHAGYSPGPGNHYACVPPITLATSYVYTQLDRPMEYIYGRCGNPSRSYLEKAIATLEGAQHGLVFASGMAAVSTAVQLLQPGQRLLSNHHLYSGTSVYFNQLADKHGVEVDLVDASDVINLRKAIRPATRMLWIETPSNPTMNLVDIAAATAIAKERNIITVADNTFMTPCYQRPLLLGVDIVLHSCTKYLNGCSDVIMGALCTNRDDLRERLAFLQECVGAVPSPFDCYLVHRAIRTLPLRMERHMRNGFTVARFLETHPAVKSVLHPGLPSHEQHELATRQCYGHSGMLSFYLCGDSTEAARAFLEALRLVSFTTSLGGEHTQAQLPIEMSHHRVAKEDNERLGVTAGLIRLSVGLEDAEDIVADLDQALNKTLEFVSRDG